MKSMPEFFVSVLAEATLRSTVLFAVAAIITLLLRSSSASALRRLVWVTALACALVVLLVSAFVPGVPESMRLQLGEALSLPDAASVGGTGSRAADTLDSVSTGGWSETVGDAEDAGFGRMEPSNHVRPCFVAVTEPSRCSTAARRSLALTSWAVIVWAVGAGTVGLYFLVGYWRRTCSEHYSTISTPQAWRAMLDSEADSLGVRDVLLLQSRFDHPVRSMSWGWLRPVILLPAVASRWSAEYLRHVVRRELVHLWRADAAVDKLVQLTCVFYWMNPLVWLARWRITVESDRAVDAFLRVPAQPRWSFAKLTVAAVVVCTAVVVMPTTRQTQTRPQTTLELRDDDQTPPRRAPDVIDRALAAGVYGRAEERLQLEDFVGRMRGHGRQVSALGSDPWTVSDLARKRYAWSDSLRAVARHGPRSLVVAVGKTLDSSQRKQQPIYGRPRVGDTLRLKQEAVLGRPRVGDELRWVVPGSPSLIVGAMCLVLANDVLANRRDKFRRKLTETIQAGRHRQWREMLSRYGVHLAGRDAHDFEQGCFSILATSTPSWAAYTHALERAFPKLPISAAALDSSHRKQQTIYSTAALF